MSMNDHLNPEVVAAAADAIRARADRRPTLALVLGSGLNQLADAVQDAAVVAYADIPHWPGSTVPGHSGRLVIGRLEGHAVVVMQGRAHLYEGYSPAHITLPVRVLHALGATTLLVTNAAGGLNPDYRPGDLMLIRDHLNLPGLSGFNPLRGPNDDDAGPRFPDMTFAYDPALRRRARDVAASLDLTLHEGVYAYISGPSFETPAELRMLRLLGADAVGMSTAPSVVVARHRGMRVLGISAITNAAHLEPQPGHVTSHDEVLETGKVIVPRLTALLSGLLRAL